MKTRRTIEAAVKANMLAGAVKGIIEADALMTHARLGDLAVAVNNLASACEHLAHAIQHHMIEHGWKP